MRRQRGLRMRGPDISRLSAVCIGQQKVRACVHAWGLWLINCHLTGDHVARTVVQVFCCRCLSCCRGVVAALRCVLARLLAECARLLLLLRLCVCVCPLGEMGTVHLEPCRSPRRWQRGDAIRALEHQHGMLSAPQIWDERVFRLEIAMPEQFR